MMWKELTIIIIVIAVSYVFAISEKRYFDSQLMFIIAALLILVIYKSLHYINIIDENKKLAGIKESFTTDIDLSKVNEWLVSTKANLPSMTLEQQTALATDYATLRKDLDTVKKLLQGLNSQQASQADKSSATPETSYDRPNMLNIASYQTMQGEKLDTLKKEADRLNSVLTRIGVDQGSKDYPKIPVYSSCVISDTTGGYSTNGSASSTSNFANTGLSASNTTPPNKFGGNNEILAKAISGLLSGGVNVNLTS